MSPYRPLRSVYAYVVRLVLPPIRTNFQMVSFSLDTRTARGRKYIRPITPIPIPAEIASGSRVVTKPGAVVVDEHKLITSDGWFFVSAHELHAASGLTY
jgi:hypothetical protein